MVERCNSHIRVNITLLALKGIQITGELQLTHTCEYNLSELEKNIADVELQLAHIYKCNFIRKEVYCESK